MNILWIEDSSKKKVQQLKKECFDNSGLFKEEKNKLITVNSLDEAFDKIDNGDLDYDFYVIDLDLTNFSMSESVEDIKTSIDPKMDNETFKKKGGHVLFLRLLEKGVKTNRVVFLTGNASGNIIRKWYRQLKNAIAQKDETQYKKTLANLIDDRSFKEFKDDFKQCINDSNMDDADEIVELITSQYDESSDTTFGKLKNLAKDAMIANYPEAFIKADPENFHLWLKESLTDQNPDFCYLSLRRGVINGCEFLIEKINNYSDDEDPILFNKTIQRKKIDSLSKNYVVDYLQKLETLLPQRVPSQNKKKELYYSFLKELSAEWDISKGKFIDGFNENSYENSFLIFCQRQMKFIRNWTAHNILGDQNGEMFISYCFLVAMRALIKMETKKSYEYELQLISSFKSTKMPFVDLKQNLAKTYFDLRSLADKNGKQLFENRNPRSNSFDDLMYLYGHITHDEQKEISKNLFYQHFWHSLFPLSTTLNPNIPGSVSFTIKFDNKNKNMPKTSFPYRIAQMIHKRSFI